MAKLTEKQKRFCEEYVVSGKAAEAATAAGYSATTVNGPGLKALRSNPQVKSYLKELKPNKGKETPSKASESMKGNTNASKFDQAIVDRICDLTANSDRSQASICAECGISPDAFRIWRHKDESVQAQYARAKEQQADYLAWQILEISDDGTNDYMTITKGDMQYNVEDREVTNRSKLRVDSRKWLASKLAPKKYGDKIDHTVEGEMKITQITGMQIR